MDEFLNNVLKSIYYEFISYSTYVKININEENMNCINTVYFIDPGSKATISEKKILVSSIRDEFYDIFKKENINFLDRTDLYSLTFITDKKITKKYLAKLKLKYTIYDFYDVDVHNRYIKFYDCGLYSPTEILYLEDLQYTKFFKKGIKK